MSAPYIMDIHGALPTLQRVEERVGEWSELHPGAKRRVCLGLAMLSASVSARGIKLGNNSPDGDPQTPDEAAELVRYAEAAALAEVSPLSPTARHERDAISAAARIATRALRELAPVVPYLAPALTTTPPTAPGA